MDTSGRRQERDQATLVASLDRADAYPHPVSNVRILETHISWVVLTGQYVYKIKKALRLQFLDFSTLEARRHYCEEELRLNKRWAPDLYLAVVPVSGSPDAPLVGGDGDPIEYAVKMLQFDQEQQLDQQLKNDRLHCDDMHDLAATIAAGHDQATVSPVASDEDTLRDVAAPMRENFPPLREAVATTLLDGLRRWTETELERLTPQLLDRRAAGFVRECHGDLHLTNLVRLPSGIVPYDCVEFSAELRTMDVLSDLSFLVMDLASRHRIDLAYTLLNRYLEISGDYGGMDVFGLYYVYHCLIRAKVAAIRNTDRSQRELAHRLAAANGWIARPAPRLIAMHGYSGSGKTWLSSRLLELLPALRLRSDIERKRLHGLAELDSSQSAPGGGIYRAEANAGVYERLHTVAERLLAGGYSVILDASFLKQEERERAASLASRCQVPFVLVATTATDSELERRLSSRGTTASEADLDVLHYQREVADALTAAERQRAVAVATDERPDFDRIFKRIKRLC